MALDKLKAKISELISKQKKLRTRYYSAKNAEKELAVVKKNVDTILKKPSLDNENKKHRNMEL